MYRQRIIDSFYSYRLYASKKNVKHLFSKNLKQERRIIRDRLSQKAWQLLRITSGRLKPFTWMAASDGRYAVY